MREATWEEAVDLQAKAPPCDYNPSSWKQRAPIAILAGLGVLIASYLALFQMGLISSVWDPLFGEGSERVLQSSAAQSMDRVLHVPDAAFGAWGYLSEAVFTLVGSTRRWQHRPWMVILFGLDVIPLGLVSAALILTQGFVVGSWCFLCLVTAAISLTLVVLAYDEVWVCLKYLRRVWRASHDKRLLWNVFCGRPSALADAVALQRG
jgi:uncharacterized membrane protein